MQNVFVSSHVNAAGVFKTAVFIIEKWVVFLGTLSLLCVKAVVLAFIMAKLESSKSRDVLNRVKKLEGIQEAYIIYGAYDLLLKASFKTPEALSSFVLDTLRKIDGIRDTVTNVCATCD